MDDKHVLQTLVKYFVHLYGLCFGISNTLNVVSVKTTMPKHLQNLHVISCMSSN